MHFKSYFWDKMWGIYYDETKDGQSVVHIREDQQGCTMGEQGQAFYLFWALVLFLGVPLLCALASYLFPLWCKGKTLTDAANSPLVVGDDVAEPLLGGDSRAGL